MLSATFDDRGGGANDPAFSVDLTSFTAIFCSPEILQIFRGNCYTSQGDPDSSFPLWLGSRAFNSLQNDVCFNHLGQKLWEKIDFLQKNCNFSGEGKNSSKLTKHNINYV